MVKSVCYHIVHGLFLNGAKKNKVNSIKGLTGQPSIIAYLVANLSIFHYANSYEKDFICLPSLPALFRGAFTGRPSYLCQSRQSCRTPLQVDQRIDLRDRSQFIRRLLFGHYRCFFFFLYAPCLSAAGMHIQWQRCSRHG